MANRVPLILNTSSNQIQELPTGDNLDLSNSGIHNAGVITATSFTGDGSGLTGLTAVGVGAIGGLTVKDEGSVIGTAGSISSFDFRGSYITATANTGAAGVTTVTLSETPTFSAVTVTNNINANGNIVGDNSTNITGISGVTASTLTGTLQTAAQPNITSLGSLSSLNVTGNVSIGGTLTYEDVTNVDAVGLITARSGVNISGGELKVGTGVTVGQSGIVSATAFSGNVNSQDGTAYVLIPGAGTGDWSQLYNTFLYNSNGQAILTPTAGSEHFAGNSDGFTAGNASNLNAGTVPTVRLGSGTANSSSFLRGDQTWAAVASVGGATGVDFNDNVKTRYGTGNDLEIFHDGTDSKISSSEGELNITHTGNGQIKFLRQGGNGISVDGNGWLLPSSSNTIHSGYSSYRWHTVWGAAGNFSGTVTANAFSGDGSNLTGISVSQNLQIDAYNNIKAGSMAGNALNSNTLRNILFGTNAGKVIDTGDDNICIGYEAGEDISSGKESVVIGNYAMKEVTTGTTRTVALGYQACRGQTSGISQVAVGYNALVTTQAASGSVAIGYQALGSQTNSGYNVAVGYDAGLACSSSNNVYLGSSAGKDHVGNNCIIIGASTDPSGNSAANEITIGDANITKFRIPGINFVLKDNGGTPSSGQVLTADGSGEGYWAAASGTTINSNADNRIITGSGSANTLNGESTFTYDGSALKVKSTHSLASWVQRTDGVWGNWSPEFNFKATGASPAGTTFGQWGNHTEGHQIVFVKSRDNGNSGTTCQAGDDLGSIFWSPYNSNNPGCAAAVKVMADSGTWSSTSNPAYMQIMTTPNGSKEPTERLRIAAHGGVIFKGGPLQEKVKITAGKLSSNDNIDLADGNVHYFTTQETTTSTPNLRVNSSITLDSVMAVGETVAVTIITTAAAAGYSAQLKIDGANVTENWVGGSAPAAGGASGVDIYNYTIIKTGSSAFTVIGNLTKTSA
jgi:hypothetical protein